MLRVYFRQTLQVLRTNPFMSIISIVGTALAIAMIMGVVIIDHIKTEPVGPDVNRKRTLYMTSITITPKDNPSWYSNSNLAMKLVDVYARGIEGAEVVTGFTPEIMVYACTNNYTNGSTPNVIYCDSEYFKAFEFDFIAGGPFTEADVHSGITNIVVCESLAISLFKSTDVIGYRFLVDFNEYNIVGVVKDVSMLADLARAQAWAPYTTTDALPSWMEFAGMFNCAIVAEDEDKFDDIKREVNNRIDEFNKTLPDVNVHCHNQPFDYSSIDIVYTIGMNNYEKFNDKKEEIRMEKIVTIIIALLIPAINLSSTIHSRMRRRKSEIGVRRAFGATQSNVIWQVLSENLLFTFIGGALGWVLGGIMVYLSRESLTSIMVDYNNVDLDVSFDAMSFFSPSIFFAAFGFCLVLNIVSALIPAWLTARQDIVKSLS